MRRRSPVGMPRAMDMAKEARATEDECGPRLLRVNASRPVGESVR